MPLLFLRIWMANISLIFHMEIIGLSTNTTYIKASTSKPLQLMIPFFLILPLFFLLLNQEEERDCFHKYFMVWVCKFGTSFKIFSQQLSLSPNRRAFFSKSRSSGFNGGEENQKLQKFVDGGGGSSPHRLPAKAFQSSWIADNCWRATWGIGWRFIILCLFFGVSSDFWTCAKFCFDYL